MILGELSRRDGRGGPGKSTLLKSIMREGGIICRGTFHTPSPDSIGYLDQEYALLNPTHTVFTAIQSAAPTWDNCQIRAHLNDFLFQKNAEVSRKTSHLSGGERARLSLACISACTPKLLLLDEITNNLDIETRQHVMNVLKNFPGSLIISSHDMNFLDEIGVDKYCIL